MDSELFRKIAWATTITLCTVVLSSNIIFLTDKIVHKYRNSRQKKVSFVEPPHIIPDDHDIDDHDIDAILSSSQ